MENLNFTATEALKLSRANRTPEFKSFFDTVIKTIHRAASEGSTHTSFRTQLPEAVTVELVRMGYEVKSNAPLDYSIVSW